MPLTTNWHLEPCSGVSVTLLGTTMVTWGCKASARLGPAAECGAIASQHVLRLQEPSRAGPYLRNSPSTEQMASFDVGITGVNFSMATRSEEHTSELQSL